MHLLFDIGGTNTRVAATYNGKTFVAPKQFPTPKSFNEGITTIVELARLYSKGKKIQGIIGGVAGPLDAKKTKLSNSPHLKGWVNKPLSATLGRALHTKVHLENDTALVGLGEAVFGAGKHQSIVAYMTISTGVNGVRIVDGQIDRNALGFEIGHQIIGAPYEFPKASICHACNQRGHLEGYVSGTSLIQKFGTHPRHIRKMSVWRDLARYLAYGVNNTIVYWSPNIVVLGGSMMKTPGIPLELVKKYTKETTKIFTRLPHIKQATLKDFGGLYGALAIIKNSKE